MAGSRSSAPGLVLLLCTSCTTILGVEDGVLDASSGTTTSATGSPTSTTTGDGGGAIASSTASGGGGAVTSAGTSTSGGGGDGGAAAVGSTGAGGDGGAVDAASTAGAGGDGGASTAGSTGAGGDGGSSSVTVGAGGGGTGGGGGCPLEALPACPGVQPNSFVVPSDLSDHWDVISPQAEVNAADQLLLRVVNGSTEARIQAKVALQQPASCAVWVRLQLPSSGGGVGSGLAIVGAEGTHAIFRLEDELRARAPAGGTASVAWDAVETARVRARFDAAGELWLDTSADGACWTAIDGPFVVGSDPLDVQIFVERPGTAGSASSTFDDFTL